MLCYAYAHRSADDGFPMFIPMESAGDGRAIAPEQHGVVASSGNPGPRIAQDCIGKLGCHQDDENLDDDE